ncbi:hypothetical protein SDC9_76971 [bioreactor metagenome]|uniref:Uncharacterized protein n=1 Tax=bioreactor metagenome TaxID=1076179 RepID=A0A644YRB9_9ZZZZ
MIVLVVGGGHVPALVQSLGVFGIAGEIAARADGPLAVAHLHGHHLVVVGGRPVSKVGEGAEGGAGVVELGQIGQFILVCNEGLIVQLHTGVCALVVEGSVVAAHKAVGIEGVDMARAAGPGHLKAGKSEA